MGWRRGAVGVCGVGVCGVGAWVGDVDGKMAGLKVFPTPTQTCLSEEETPRLRLPLLLLQNKLDEGSFSSE